MYEFFDYVSLRQLGEIFELTSHQVGQHLLKGGLRARGSSGKLEPTKRAWADGYCRDQPVDERVSFVSWHREKTVKFLQNAGLDLPGFLDKPIPGGLADSPTSGPFEIGNEDERGFPLFDAQGIELAVFSDVKIGRRTAWLMTQADRHGKL